MSEAAAREWCHCSPRRDPRDPTQAVLGLCLQCGFAITPDTTQPAGHPEVDVPTVLPVAARPVGLPEITQFGWWQPDYSNRLHYFKEDRRALCGQWAALGAIPFIVHVRFHDGQCKACQKKLAKQLPQIPGVEDAHGQA
jgi:hypothetical protein